MVSTFALAFCDLPARISYLRIYADQYCTKTRICYHDLERFADAIAFSANIFEQDSFYGELIRTMEGTGSKPLVLLVDDNDDIRDMMRLIHEDGGFSVIEATNGLQAVEKAASNPPSVILMDIAMPLM